jgi:hypothetical protein
MDDRHPGAAPVPDEPGHLFVARGDLRELACDALLVPTDDACHVGGDWADLVPVGVRPSGRWPEEPWALDSAEERPSAPRVWLAATAQLAEGGGTPTEVQEALAVLLERVERFVAAAAQAARDEGRARLRPLLGVPVVGTGAGGLRARPGAVVSALVERLATAATDHRADVVVVARSPELEALCRHWRRKVWETQHGGREAYLEALVSRWRRGEVVEGEVHEVPAADHLRELLDRSRRGNLVPFFGSGVSRASGAPSWTGMLDDLSPRGAVELFGDLNPQDAAQMSDPFARAQVIANLDEGGSAGLRRRLEERLAIERLSLLHVLLANVGARDAITTNYDVGYERACRAAGIEVQIVPSPGGTHRLVKLHGSLGDAGGEPLLTRDQLLDFQTDRGAIAGVLQMLLLTGHLLFIGYSMSDPSLHGAIHAVRRAIEQEAGTGRPSMATSLQVDPSPALSALWDRTIEVVWPAADRYPSAGERVRQKEILLDLLADAASHATIPLLAMDDEAASLDLTGDERELRDALVALEQAHRRDRPRTALWGPVEELLDRFHRRH